MKKILISGCKFCPYFMPETRPYHRAYCLKKKRYFADWGCDGELIPGFCPLPDNNENLKRKD